MGVEPSRSAVGFAGGRAACPADFFMCTRAARFYVRARSPRRAPAQTNFGVAGCCAGRAPRRKVLIDKRSPLIHVCQKQARAP